MSTSFSIGVYVLIAVMYLLSAGVAIVMYVFESLGVYTIAKRRTIKHPWLAWIPVAKLWMLGCVSDQYRYVAKGKVTNRRKILLALGIVTSVLGCIMAGCYINVFTQLIGYGRQLEYMNDTQIMSIVLTPALSLLGVCAVVSIVGIVQTVFQYIALYDLYASCEPRNAVLYLVLSIFFNVTEPFFVFACRNKDLGMPPRRPTISEQSWQPPEQPTWQPVQNQPQEPWEQKPEA